MSPLFSNDNSALVGGIGLIVSVVGLVVTVAAFWIAIVQIAKVKNSAEAARKAVSGVQTKISRFDAAVDLAQAKGSLQNARRYANLEAWQEFIVSCDTAAEAIGRVAVMAAIIDKEVSESLKKSKSRIVRSCYAVEKHVEGAAPPPRKSEINRSIRTEISLLQNAEQQNWTGAVL